MKGTFIEKLNYLLDERHLSKAQLLNELSINKNQYHRWETGENLPSKRTVQVLADYFFVTPTSLVNPNVDIERTYVEKDLGSDFNILPLSDIERTILNMFREVPGRTQVQMITAITRLYDEETSK